MKFIISPCTTASLFLMAAGTAHAFAPSATLSARPSSRTIGTPPVGSSRSGSSTTTSSTELYGFFSFGEKEKEPEVPVLPDVVIDPDYRPGAALLALGILLDQIPYIQLTLGPFVTILGALFLYSATKYRLCFDSTSFELKGFGKDGELEPIGDNLVVGGKNRWATNTFVNYEFFPKGWELPLLVYFKETQTPEEFWNQGPGAQANDPEKIASGEAAPGQVHFFPAAHNVEQIKEQFNSRGCQKL